ncbi:SusC/RagA family TonB-linked outer membrane protein [Algibacter miyuki]|nr:SusC/RagA family TonB-linked outer membrane protein [Algibacter miyuki]MDN3667639.1 SusC/RagA family TonB-linked outer membrane protein [Algibacter miyuki]
MKQKLFDFNFEYKIRDSIKKSVKCFAVFLLINVCYAFTDSYSQTKTFNIQFKDVSLKKVISEIEKQSEFVIIYDDEVWGLLNKRVRNFEVKNKNIREVLNKILSVDEFAYTINDRQVVIHKREGKPLEVTEAPVLQTRTISGTILDEGGMPVPGVNILVVGTKRGTQTDFDGLYNIKADKGEVIEFSFVGMETQRVTVVDKDVINLTLKEDAAALDEVVVVAFGEQKKESVVASITTIKPSELKIPSSNLTTALAGRVSGLISYQRSGEPGADNAEFFVRGISTFGQGASPLILLDGFEISANELSRVQPDDIASFSVMKDATATSLYGARGANGVILITTKEGKEGKAQISFRHETSFSRPTQIPQVVGGVEYMELYNQAQFNDDPLLPKFYNVQRIENTKNGLNPYAFPDVNWYDELFKSQTVNSRYNINVTGGGKVATYYLAGSILVITGY